MPSQKKKKPKNTPSKLGEIGHSRDPRQKRHMQTTVGKGICPFCKIDRNINPEDLFVGDWWIIRRNAFPYRNHREHFVLTTIGHFTDISKLPAAAWAEWGRINNWAIKKFNLPGGALVMRFGEFRYSGATLGHLHSHIQVPNLRNLAVAVLFQNPRARILVEEAICGPKRKKK